MSLFWFHARLLLLMSVVLLTFWQPVQAASPMEDIKSTTDKIIDIVTNPHLKEPEQKDARARLIRAAVDERFDWEEISRRTVGRYWARTSAEQRATFTELFSRLLERTYMDRVDDYSGEQVVYLEELIDGNYALVKVMIQTPRSADIPVDYRIINKDGKWLIYDINIQGVSLVNNYRIQFSNILARSSFDDLVAQLRERVEKP